jgi:hypothetical protein
MRKALVFSFVGFGLLAGCDAQGNAGREGSADAKMIVPSHGGGYKYVGGTKISTSVAQRAIKEAIADGVISPDILD